VSIARLWPAIGAALFSALASMPGPAAAAVSVDVTPARLAVLGPA